MMVPVIQQQPPASTKVTEAPHRRPAPNGDHQDDRQLHEAFESLLAISQGTFARRVENRRDRTSILMFEETIEATGGEKMARLSEEFRSAIDENADRFHDARRGIEARRADRAPHVATGRHTDGEVGFFQREGTGPRPANEPSEVPKPKGLPLAARTAPSGKTERVDVAVQARARVAPAGSEPPVAATHARPVAPPVSTAAAAQPAPIAPASVAEEVGRLLGATRNHETPSARTTAPVQGAPDQRSAASDHQTQTARHAGERSTPRAPNDTRQSSSGERTRFDKLVSSIRLRMGAHRSSAQLRLNPPQLGRVRVDVRLAGDRLMVGVQAETEAAKEILSRRAETLRAALNGQGIQVDRFEIVANTTEARFDAPVAGGDAGGAGRFSRDNAPVDPSSSRGALGSDGMEDFDDMDPAGTAGLAPSVAGKTRLDIRI